MREGREVREVVHGRGVRQRNWNLLAEYICKKIVQKIPLSELRKLKSVPLIRQLEEPVYLCLVAIASTAALLGKNRRSGRFTGCHDGSV